MAKYIKYPILPIGTKETILDNKESFENYSLLYVTDTRELLLKIEDESNNAQILVVKTDVDLDSITGGLYSLSLLLDSAIEDLNLHKLASNPHGITPDLIGSYDRETIDNKDDIILNLAKGYTFSQSVITQMIQDIIDNTNTKTEATNLINNMLAAAKQYTRDYTYHRNTIDSRIESVLGERLTEAIEEKLGDAIEPNL